jgi:hypothetical protein
VTLPGYGGAGVAGYLAAAHPDLAELAGVVSCSRWRPGPGDSGAAAEVYQFCAVGRKP